MGCLRGWLAADWEEEEALHNRAVGGEERAGPDYWERRAMKEKRSGYETMMGVSWIWKIG